MRLLFVSNVYPNPAEPGKGMFNKHLVAALSQQHEVHVLSPVSWVDEWRARRSGRWSPDLGRARHSAGVSVSYPRYYYSPGVLRSWYGSFYWHSVRPTLLSILKVHRPEAVISYWAHPDGEAALRAARMAGVPGIVIVGGSDVLVLAKDRSRRKCIARTLQAADAVVPVSEDLKARIVELGAVPSKVHVVPRGVDPLAFSPGNQVEARNRLGIPSDGKVLVWVGRMVAVKGLNVLLRACVRLRDRLPFRLYLVGKGPLEQELRASCRALGLADQVLFPGPCGHDQLGSWYRAADVTVLPSLSEGIPNVLRESLACGTPFVASNVGGIPELARLGWCLLTPPGNEAALAAALAEMLLKPASPVQHTALPSWKDSAQMLEEIIRKLVSPSQQGPAVPGPLPTTAALPPRDGSQAPTRARGPSSCRQLLRRTMNTVLPRSLFLTRGPSSALLVALTFDDGPHPVYTPRLLDLLQEHQAPSTFFVIGEQARSHPDLVRRMVAEGHVVAMHSYFPRAGRQPTRPVLGWENDLRRSSDLLHEILGQRVRLYRPPFGKVTVPMLCRAWGSGLTLVLWNVDSKDYRSASAAEVRQRIQQHPFAAGDIVLMHDSFPHCSEVVVELIASLRRQELEPTPLAAWVAPYNGQVAGHLLAAPCRLAPPTPPPNG